LGNICALCGRRSQFKLTLGYFLFLVAAWFVVAALAILLRVFVFHIPQGSSRELGYWVGAFLVGVCGSSGWWRQRLHRPKQPVGF